MVPIAVWNEDGAYTGIGLNVRDDEGPMEPLIAENIANDVIEIVLPRAVGLVKIRFQSGIRSMTSMNGVPCAGGAVDVFFGRDCIPNAFTFCANITRGGVTQHVDMIGSLNRAEFRGLIPNHPDDAEYILEWLEGAEFWRIITSNLSMDPLDGIGTTRCNPLGIYIGTLGQSAEVVTPENCCDPNTTTYYARIFSQGNTINTIFTGSLNTAQFTSPEGYFLEWPEGNSDWRIRDPSGIISGMTNLFSSRCEPVGEYLADVAGSALVSIIPIP
jgi:hypothetical protein